MSKEIVMYHRTKSCPYVTLAKRILAEAKVEYREILFDKDTEAAKRVEAWTGYLTAPTLIVANKGEDLPFESPADLPSGASPRNIDRGSMISEPSAGRLKRWLERHGFID